MSGVTADFFVVQVHNRVETKSGVKVRTNCGEIKPGNVTTDSGLKPTTAGALKFNRISSKQTNLKHSGCDRSDDLLGFFLSKQSLDRARTVSILASVAAPGCFQVPDTHGCLLLEDDG
jgi:hypothetical protein